MYQMKNWSRFISPILGPLLAFIAAIMVTGASDFSSTAESKRPIIELRMGGRDVCKVNPLNVGSTESAAKLLIPIISALGDQAFSAAGAAMTDYVKKVASGSTENLGSVLQSNYFYRLLKSDDGEWSSAPAINCIAIIVTYEGPENTSKRSIASESSKADSPEWSASLLQRANLEVEPQLYLEFSVEADGLNGVFRLVPRTVRFRGEADKAGDDAAFDILLNFSEVTRPAFATIPIHVPQQWRNIREAERVRVINTPWVPLPRFSTRFRNADEIYPDLSSVLAMPFNLSAAIRHSRSSNEFIGLTEQLLVRKDPTRAPEQDGSGVSVRSKMTTKRPAKLHDAR